LAHDQFGRHEFRALLVTGQDGEQFFDQQSRSTAHILPDCRERRRDMPGDRNIVVADNRDIVGDFNAQGFQRPDGRYGDLGR
jgi:hypothetical protein